MGHVTNYFNMDPVYSNLSSGSHRACHHLHGELVCSFYITRHSICLNNTINLFSNGDCMSFDPSNGKVWFKVDEDGMTKGVWGSLKLISQGDSWSVAIPPTIKAGQYLLRLELLAYVLFFLSPKCPFLVSIKI